MKKNTVYAAVSAILFIILIVLLKTVDVQPAGPGGTSIGLSALNLKFHDITGVHMAWYNITDWLGYGALAVCAVFGLAGLMQLINRKSLLKVDKCILALGVFYIVVIGFYLFFEKCVINYRPIIMPGADAPEASFPSSHTMLIICVMASTRMVISRYIKPGALRSAVKVACTLVMVVTVFGRMYCGVHWLTDIIGGILLSVALVETFSLVLDSAGKADAAANKARKSAGK